MPHAQIIFFPVRHHSPAGAKLLRQLALEIQPAAILIEGPSDFNDRLHELALPHQLPIAIYSYICLPNGKRRGAFYPFCIYSPEWQALQVARELGIPAQFIDLPWADVVTENAPSHRYGDAELKQSGYVPRLCEKLGVENFDALWDTLFEIESLTPTEYLERSHQFCFHIRITTAHIPATILRREAFMGEAIRRARKNYSGQILVVTGGFHSYALYEQLCLSRITTAKTHREEPSFEARGIALTPYSYQRLDNLAGYESGMPNPGFYHAVWQNRLTIRAGLASGLTPSKKSSTPTKTTPVYRSLLARVARHLRQREQSVSCADLIAVETMARGLATLRGHAEVWRQDLIDGIIGALVKEEIYSGTHPFLQAVDEVFRGQERGRLAAGTTLPPLVRDIQQQLHEYDLEPTLKERIIALDLSQAAETQGETALSTTLQKSQFLHRLRILEIDGFRRTDGTDFIDRKDLFQIWEQWTIRWTPEFEARCIEVAIYGATLTDGANARLLELAESIERDAEKAALLLLDAGLMGLDDLSESLYRRLVELIRQDSNFFTTTKALGHLLYLYLYDEILGTTGRSDIGTLLVEIWQRCLWLLEELGQVRGMERELLSGLCTILETFDRCSSMLPLNRDNFVQILYRVSVDSQQTPLMQGATTGALWTLGEVPIERAIAELGDSVNPVALGHADRVGDFLTGLFYLARETAQRHPELILKIDELLMAYDDETFLAALPALRLAFSYFTPREKHYMVQTLLLARSVGEAEEATEDAPLIEPEVSADMAARALAFETRLFEAVRRYGLRGER
jgi:hypothetical protein